jgi:predicted TIM-barrel fold metal-dependent hydrolase
MLIDFHVHLGDTVPLPDANRREVTAHQLIDRMNREGIDRTVLLPLESPEGASGYYLTRDALRDYRQYPERLIPFVSIDPRMTNAVDLIDFYRAQGCVGFGELKNGLAFDDDRNRALYARCDELGWAIVFHIDPTLCWDEKGLPRLEACLREFPNAKFCGHGPGFWCAISGDDERQGGYPKGPVVPGGAVDRLLGEHANLFGEISAGSGHNALTRDPEFTEGFVERHWRQLLFGTDLMFCGQELPQVRWLRDEGPLNEEQREAIGSGNALRLLTNQ